MVVGFGLVVVIWVLVGFHSGYGLSYSRDRVMGHGGDQV